MTLAVDDLLESLRRTPDGPAFVGGPARGELAQRALAVAAGLHARGIGEGDTVALALRPGPGALAAVLGAVRLRARVALVDPAAGPDLVAARLRAASARLVVTDPIARAAAGWGAPFARRLGLRLPRLSDIAPAVGVGALLRSSAGASSPDRAGTAADALLVFTSGTTGRPRTVVHTTSSLAAGIAAVGGLVDVTPGVPVVGSTFFVMAPALLAGAPVARVTRARAVARLHARLRPQLTYLTPPQLRDLLALGPRLHGACYAGSAPVSAGVLSRLRVAGASAAYGVYALTEAFPVAVVSAEEKAAYDGLGDLLGAPVGEMRVVVGSRHLRGSESDLRSADVTTSQMLVSGPATADRYLGEPPLEQVETGDAGEVLADGRVVLHGRLKDMVLRRAENIYPGLYEPALHVPGVALAVLVGVPAPGPDPDGDELLALLVETEPDVAVTEVERRLREPLARMGAARPDHVVYAAVPTAGRSRKPDRRAARELAVRMIR